MKRLTVLSAFLLVYAGGAAAIQPVEAGLIPLQERLQLIDEQQDSQNQALRHEATSPRDRAIAWRTYQALDLEKRQLEASSEEARKLATSPLVMFALPAASAR